jgi:uncharacterized protein (DUF305 family)
MSMAPGMVMPGMLADQDITALQNAQGADASKLFLTGMIQHHQGAIAMAQVGSKPASRSAGPLDRHQQQEINTMQTILGSL